MSDRASKKNQHQLPLAHLINWVAVSERLPELNIETEYGKTTKGILCLHSKGHMESCNLNEGIDEGDEPYWSYEQDGDLCETVTHWADVKEKPSLEIMDKFLAMMEEEAKDNSEPIPNFPKGTD